MMINVLIITMTLFIFMIIFVRLNQKIITLLLKCTMTFHPPHSKSWSWPPPIQWMASSYTWVCSSSSWRWLWGLPTKIAMHRMDRLSRFLWSWWSFFAVNRMYDHHAEVHPHDNDHHDVNPENCNTSSDRLSRFIWSLCWFFVVIHIHDHHPHAHGDDHHGVDPEKCNALDTGQSVFTCFAIALLPKLWHSETVSIQFRGL